ncbi:MAG TPA: hypothetical protein VKR60_15590 [Candidatus Sulfotelmatobacter sp.]|nr:hypothetical protein [Candidatus Sulfotelmatobacter sp.]
MAHTPHGSWLGCTRFGLRDLLEQSTMRSETVQMAMDEINRSLDELGVTNFQVESIKNESPAGADVAQWVVTLVSKLDRTKTYSLGWSRTP